MNKKGISPVVASLLIVLITIAAVFIVWGVIKKQIESGAGEMTKIECLKVDLSIDSFDNNGVTISLRSIGDAPLSSLRIILGNNTYSNSITVNRTGTSSDLPVVGGKKTYSISVSNPTYARVVPILSSGTKTFECQYIESTR